MEKKYTEPKINIVILNVDDVITTSGGNTCEYKNTDSFDGEWVCLFGTSR